MLIGIAAVRAHAEFQGSDALVWGWRIVLVVTLALLLALRLLVARPTVVAAVDAD